ncbi:MAG: hemerythrin domain-containing protein [Candidatus Micrarchaeota archaeon]|nr:hemerythrin domain-containing protein [Candidatus Micrarchaeota archaeon]
MEIIHVLMAEHRVIERMVALMKKELGNEALSSSANQAFIYAAVDFFKNYADTTHHGKEEGILFKSLEAKPLSPEHRSVMDQLVNEHRIAREEVKGLYESAQRYERGDLDAIAHISAHLKRLTDLYPPHIALEDRHFFLPAMEYFSPEERGQMLDDAYDHDADMAHRKYVDMVLRYEEK